MASASSHWPSSVILTCGGPPSPNLSGSIRQADCPSLALGLDLAGARGRFLPPSALASWRCQLLEVVTGGAPDVPAREQRVRDTIAWSYDLLTAPEQRLFRCLSVFVGGFALEEAEAVCEALGDETGRVFDGVTSLLDKSLVQRRAQEDEEPRLLMLETIREFGLV